MHTLGGNEELALHGVTVTAEIGGMGPQEATETITNGGGAGGNHQRSSAHTRH